MPLRGPHLCFQNPVHTRGQHHEKRTEYRHKDTSCFPQFHIANAPLSSAAGKRRGDLPVARGSAGRPTLLSQGDLAARPAERVPFAPHQFGGWTWYRFYGSSGNTVRSRVVRLLLGRPGYVGDMIRVRSGTVGVQFTILYAAVFLVSG